MTDAEHNVSPDEQVYKDNKSETGVKKVYDEDPQGATTANQNRQPDEIAPGVTQDEASAESFPASDPPTPMASSSIPATHRPEESGTSNVE